MQELNEKLNKINDIRKEIKNTINEKGGELTDTTPFEEYPTAIENLKSGGGETVMAYYNGTDVEAGKKVLLTRTNNAMATDDGFVNGYKPYLIHDGIAYCGGGTTREMTSCMNIIDGQISNENLGEPINMSGSYGSAMYSLYSAASLTTVTSIGYTYVHYALNASAILQTKGPRTYGTNNGVDACIFIKDRVFKLATHANSSSEKYLTPGRRLFLLENSLVWFSNTSCTFPAKLIDKLDKKSNLFYSADVVGIYDGKKPGLWFERKEDAGEFIYVLFKYNSTATKWDFGKYTHETRKVATSRDTDTEIVVPYYDVSLIDKSGTHDVLSKGIYVQTKDYKYLLCSDYYVQLDYRTSILDEPTGIVVKDYPDVIKTAMGERTIASIQVFYDNSFALSLSDGTTLMCSYDGEISPEALIDNDLLLHNGRIVEEIAPYVLPDDENIYFRHFTVDKAYWFLSLSTGETHCLDKATAHPYQADKSISSYLAVKNTVGRYNSTVLTGFMTGETAEDNGLQLVEVKTVTG